MKRRFVLLALLALPVLVASAQRDQVQAQRELRPVPNIVAHEWGVWLIEDGRPTLQALADESPPFVLRAENAPTTPPPVPVDRPIVARKPVLFLRSDVPVDDLQVEVRFRGGRPWLLFPSGQVDGNRVVWRGRLAADGVRGPVRGRRRPIAMPPAAPPGHWWNHLRDVGANTFRSTHGGAERFIFYDGPVRFRSPVVASRLRARRNAHTLWMVEGANVVEHRVTTRSSSVARRGTKQDLRGWLETAATRAGLTQAEARSLLQTWEGELFESDERRAIYFIPRSDYNRMLPLTITPTPTELIRVGLVIEEL